MSINKRDREKMNLVYYVAIGEVIGSCAALLFTFIYFAIVWIPMDRLLIFSIFAGLFLGILYWFIKWCWYSSPEDNDERAR